MVPGMTSRSSNASDVTSTPESAGLHSGRIEPSRTSAPFQRGEMPRYGMANAMIRENAGAATEPP